MNSVQLIGRLCSDPYMADSATTSVAKMTLAVDRPPTKDGEKQADFPRVIAFGKTAEMVSRYLTKGRKIAVSGRIQTGSYEKNGQTIYTCDVVADRIEFLDSTKEAKAEKAEAKEPEQQMSMEEGMFLDPDIPF